MGNFFDEDDDQYRAEDWEAIVEAVLFTMGNSVELSRLAAAIEHDEETTRKLIHNMMDRYAQEGRGVRIIELEDSFQMCTAPEFYDTIIKVATQPKKQVLTDVLLEGTHLLYLGDEDIITQAFGVKLKDHTCFLPGVVSRKKQVIPMLTALWG